MTTPRYLRRAKVEIEHMGVPTLSVDQSLRITFFTTRDNQPDDASSEVRIFNLSPNSESLISDKGDLVRVMAGYGDALGLIAEGEIRRVKHEPMERDRVTTISIGKSDRARTNAIVAHSYQGAHSYAFLAADLVARMGLALLSTVELPDHRVVNWTYTGKASDALTDLLEPTGFGWYEEFGAVKFSRHRQTPFSRTFVLDEASGLIGYPSMTEDGVRAQMTLNTELELNQVVHIKSSLLRGHYKITSISHRGDTWSGEYLTEVEGKAADILVRPGLLPAEETTSSR